MPNIRHYRGKTIEGEWVYGYYIVQPMSSGGTAPYIFDGQYEYRVDPATVGQYVGLADKNGKEIYGSDILKRTSTLSDQTYYYKVEWDAENARFMAVSISGTLRELVSSAVERGCTVCGTIPGISAPERDIAK